MTAMRIPPMLAVLLLAACARFPEVVAAQAPYADLPAPPLAPLDGLLAAAAEVRGTEEGRAATTARGDALRTAGTDPGARDAARDDIAGRADMLRAAAQTERDAGPPTAADDDRGARLRDRARALRATP